MHRVFYFPFFLRILYGGVNSPGVNPTRSMGLRNSLLNENKMWVDFRVLENSSPRRNGFSLELPLSFYFYFIKGKIK